MGGKHKMQRTITVLKERRKDTEKILAEIMIENFSKFMKKNPVASRS